MLDDLFPYYEEELLNLRRLCDEFAVRHPEAAGRLRLQPGWGSADPHVERLIEAFALLAARIHRRLDDGFPEVVQALLGTLYPHYLAPIPSALIVQCVPVAGQPPPPAGTRVERHSRLRSPPAAGGPCRFRTTYPVTLWPVRVAAAVLTPPPFSDGSRPPDGTAAALTLRLERTDRDGPFADLPLEHLRFYLAAEPRVAVRLYELLFSAASRVVFRSATGEGDSVGLPPDDCLRPVGFGPDEGLYPYPQQALPGYRLLTELFAFPSKFLFFDLAGFDRARGAGRGRGVTVTVYLREWDPGVHRATQADTFRLGCAPAVNLFEQVAEAITLDHVRHEYPVVPDAARAGEFEVYSVDSVSGFEAGTGRTVPYRQMHSVAHPRPEGAADVYWLTHRRPSTRPGDTGTDVFLRLVDLSFSPTAPSGASLIVRTTCSNRNLPAGLADQSREVVFEIEGPSPPGATIKGLIPPTARLGPPADRRAFWRLISHLTLNHLSIVPPERGPPPLQELLRLYDFTAAEYRPDLWSPQRLIDGIRAVTSRRVTERLGPGPEGFARGLEVTIEFDEGRLSNGGCFLFASVLDRFLGLYTSINSFVTTVVRLHPSGRSFRWKPRAGTRTLV